MATAAILGMVVGGLGTVAVQRIIASHAQNSPTNPPAQGLRAGERPQHLRLVRQPVQRGAY